VGGIPQCDTLSYLREIVRDDTRIRDHCHLTGRYRGPAHSNCNLNYKDLFYIPIVFYNLSGYDSHFIIKEIAITFESKIDVLPITKEKYISFTKHVKDIAEKSVSRNYVELRFVDLYKFLSISLDKLALFLNIEKLKHDHNFQNWRPNFNFLTLPSFPANTSTASKSRRRRVYHLENCFTVR